MRKVLATLAVGSMALLAIESVRAQDAAVAFQRGRQVGGPGQGAGRGFGQGTGQKMGRGAGQGMQPRRGQGQGQYQGDMFTLVSDPVVRTELRLTAEQIKRIDELGNTEIARAARQMLSERGSCERTDDRRKVMSQVRDEIEKILEEEQWERLEQIWLQVRGVRALQSERVAQTLKLSHAQRGELARLLSGGFLGRAAEIEAQALDVLSEEQRRRFVAMQGPAFEKDPRNRN
jgi:hypothetical protein